MNKANFISPSHVRELFTYSEGQLFWKAKRKGRKRSQAGYQSKAGYTQIRIDGKLFYLHRLVWAYHFDEFFSEIDHIDGNPANNRVENLRPATHQQNIFNSKKRTNNTSGFIGVSKCPSGWVARIKMNDRHAYLGVFDSPEAASNAYQTAAAKHHKEFVRSNP